MPYTLHQETHGIVCTFTDDFSDEMLEANQEILDHPDFENFLYQLLDLRDVKTFSISNESILAIAKADSENFKRNRHHRIAVVCDEVMMVGLNNVYLAYSEIADPSASWESQVFSSEAEAREWLGG